jgi:hypothetical protein
MLISMMIIDYDWSLSNPGPDELIVWLEPWAEEFVVPPRSTIALRAGGGSEERVIGDIEWASDHVVVWGTATIIEVFIDDALQDTSSAIVPIPDCMTKEMLTIVFAGRPSARLGGVASSAVDRVSWWERLRRRFRST